MADELRPRPRVLHILKGLPLGGLETWLMHVLRNADRDLVRHELVVMIDPPGAYEAEVRELGIPIHFVPHKGSWLGWFARFGRFLIAEGPFQLVHSHVAYPVSAPALAVASACGVPSRIAHQHEARSFGSDYRSLSKRLIRKGAMLIHAIAATRRIGITDSAIEEIAGSNWRGKENCSVLLYGFDYGSFADSAERAADLRRELGLSPGDKVVGHVGRFDPVKNHAFLLRAFAMLARAQPSARLVLVGKGRLETEIRGLARELKIEDRVRFAGPSRDVAAHMAMFDLFAFPSFSEGLGIVCLEAQAAGTRVLASDTVPGEAAVVPGAVDFMPVAAGEQAWADRMKQLMSLPAPDAAEWRRAVQESAFGIARCVRDLEGIYRQELRLGR